MSKKVLITLIGVLIVIGLAILIGVVVNMPDPDNSMMTDNTSKSTKVNPDSKALVVYFSKTGENYNVGTVDVGNTAMMASYIKDYLNADSFEIMPVKKYSDNYTKSTEEAKKEQNENARPEIKNKLENLEEYDTIFLGYPIWWGDLPMIVYTFLEEYDFSGKTIIPFNTHEGSGNAGTYTTLKNKMKDSNVNTNGLALTGKKARTEEGKEETIEWLKELGY